MTEVPEPRLRQAVLIGINYVNDKNARLYGCINDVVQTKHFLQDAFGYPEDNITILRDDNYDGAIKPTKTNILSHLSQLVNNSDSCEEIWIHFSGHGAQTKDDDGDELDGKDEIIIPCDYKKQGVIRDDTLFDILSKSNCRTYIVMDCCHSGTSIDLPHLYDLKNDELHHRIVNKKAIDKQIFKHNPHVYMVSGCRDTQTSADGWDAEMRSSMGATTQSLIETLRESNYYIELEELLKNMQVWMKEKKHTQRPNISCAVEEGIHHIVQKPEYRQYRELDVNCESSSCEQCLKKIKDLEQENTITWYENTRLKKQIDVLQYSLNHYVEPRLSKELQTRSKEISKELDENDANKSKPRHQSQYDKKLPPKPIRDKRTTELLRRKIREKLNPNSSNTSNPNRELIPHSDSQSNPNPNPTPFVNQEEITMSVKETEQQPKPSHKKQQRPQNRKLFMLR